MQQLSGLIAIKFALGYLNREELTRQRFIDRPSTVPASFGSKLYRTGDWGYLLANNKLEICGRCDSMVKSQSRNKPKINSTDSAFK